MRTVQLFSFCRRSGPHTDWPATFRSWHFGSRHLSRTGKAKSKSVQRILPSSSGSGTAALSGTKGTNGFAPLSPALPLPPLVFGAGFAGGEASTLTPMPKPIDWNIASSSESSPTQNDEPPGNPSGGNVSRGGNASAPDMVIASARLENKRQASLATHPQTA